MRLSLDAEGRHVHHRQRGRRALPPRPQLRPAVRQRARRQRLVVLQRGVPRVLLPQLRPRRAVRPLHVEQRPAHRRAVRAAAGRPELVAWLAAQRRAAPPEARAAPARDRRREVAARRRRRAEARAGAGAAEDGAARRQLQHPHERRGADVLQRADRRRADADGRVPRLPRAARRLVLLRLAERQRDRLPPDVGGAVPPHRPDRHAQPAHGAPPGPAADRARRLVGVPLARAHARALRAHAGATSTRRSSGSTAIWNGCRRRSAVYGARRNLDRAPPPAGSRPAAARGRS